MSTPKKHNVHLAIQTFKVFFEKIKKIKNKNETKWKLRVCSIQSISPVPVFERVEPFRKLLVFRKVLHGRTGQE